MKVYISVDMEGIAGIAGLVNPDQAGRDHFDYGRFRRLMTEEANAAIAGAFLGGAERVVVNDSHGSMSNILIEELDPRALLISGSPKPYGMMQGIGEEFDVALLIGYHAAAGTGAAVLEHTSSGIVHNVAIDGRTVGEVGMNAQLAAHHGVPVILVAGDLATTREAREILGGIEVVVTKEGITRTSALCRSPRVVADEIREATVRALGSVDRTPRLQVRGKTTLRVEFQRAAHADVTELIPGASRENGNTVSRLCADMPELYRTYRAMLLLAAGV